VLETLPWFARQATAQLRARALVMRGGAILHRYGPGSWQRSREVIQVDFSESHKFAIAGLHCATLELVRDQPGLD
jgi:hypothetical protein